MADNKPKRLFETPRFRKSLRTADHTKAGIVLSTLYRYRNGAIPADFGAVLETYPLAGFDLAVDLIERKAGTLPPQLAALLDLARREVATALDSTEICQSDSRIAA